MLFFSPRTYIFIWGWALLFLSVFFLFLFFFLIINSITLHLFWDIFSSTLYTLTLNISLDTYSSLFSFSVSLISSVVFFFTSHYFHTYTNITYFSWLTFLFVLSILILINFSDFFFVMLGWDGLGVVSFFLILYYQSPVSTYSSLFTLLINRIGDCLFVGVILLFSYSSPTLGYLFSTYTPMITSILLILALSTNSALFPFSPWLPAAIAAPTPISSLVHSSTLVTAGLYIIIRNFSLLSSSSTLLNFLLTLGLFTSFYAGLSALVEPDLNNVVALSTLSHLGFICFSLGLGWCLLAFFHLLSHAFFKSSLFISLGSFISSHYHYQESRVLSALSTVSPSISSVIAISEFSLMGFPFVSGFYSKDLILEAFTYSLISFFLVSVVYINLLLTYSYVFRILTSLTSSTNLPTLLLVSQFPNSFLFFLFLLSIVSLTFGVLFYITISPQLFLVSPFTNYFPSFLLSAFFVLWLLMSSFPPVFSNSVTHFLGFILYLTFFFTNYLSQSYLFVCSSLYRFELGIFSSSTYSWIVEIYLYISSYMYYFYNLSINHSSVSTLLVILVLLVMVLV